MKNMIALLPFFLFCKTCFAWFCPTNFNQIQMDDTIATVQQQCGKPDEEKTIKEKPVDTGPQEWGYYVQQSPRNPTSMKLTVVFTEGKAINISVNGAGISTTNLCSHPIKTTDSMETVKNACGAPMFINKGQESLDKKEPAANEITEYKYNSANPPTTLIFENGKLKSRLTS
jgi:hypothetical protein